ncbi:hypothetical protein GCM10010306_002840 [Streptomyces umbrinus]|uniref:hypothetical protein n=1 Tax=Streptomyces umbrinus TaxID=67370 RepID=UPI00167B0959|nr:hypothetical protein [Streptomyces umbrinus]GHB15070.1 hypothetical protein GCM10010306_002840 [Streptomyces umbrinus]
MGDLPDGTFSNDQENTVREIQSVNRWRYQGAAKSDSHHEDELPMGKDPDLRVNVSLLTESESRLKSLKKEFNNIDTRTDEMRPYWGSSDIADAMNEFVDNWDDYRAKMLNSIDTVGKLVKSSIDGFGGLDGDLAKGLQEGKKK